MWISDFTLDFWISGFLSGFLDCELDRNMISRPPVGFLNTYILYDAGVLKRRVCELFNKVFQGHCPSKQCENGSTTWYYLMREDRETLYLDSS